MKQALTITPELGALIGRLGKDIDEGIPAGMTSLLADLEAEAVQEAPEDTSNLVNSITSYVTDGGRTGVLKATAPYALFVHEGTAPHVILPKDKKALAWPGGAHPVKKVNHPGTKANPFFIRAMDKVDMPASFEEGLQNFLDRRGW